MRKNYTYTFTKGFTLVELLVVIAIIGILASIVIASVSSSRKRASDSMVMSQLKSARLQAEVYKEYGGNSSYLNVCDDSEFKAFYEGAKKASGATTGYDCNDSASAWAAYVPFKNSTTGWCVDSKGIEKARGALRISEKAC